MLQGIRVLDLTDESGFLAGKILGDMGADVIKVEPLEGHVSRRRGPFLGDIEGTERSLLWLAMNTSKRSVALDIDSDAGRERFHSLASTADVLIETERPGSMTQRGLGWAALRERNPRLVYCAITPFGQTGPWAAYRAHDLVVVALGGNAALTGHPDRPPVRCSMPTSHYHGGPEAALGIAMALFARVVSGRGQFVDVSLHETQLQSLLSTPGQFAYTGKLASRGGERVGGLREIWPAKDGYVSFGLRGGPARLANLKATVEFMAESGAAPDWLVDYDWENYNHNLLSEDELARLEAAFAAFFCDRTMRELYDAALERRILLAPCNNAKEIAEQPQLRTRELFSRIDYPKLDASIEHPNFFAFARGIGIRRPAPELGEHNEEVFSELSRRAAHPNDEAGASTPGADPARGALSGLRVLELGSGAAGPVASRYFAEHGAEVIRIESSKRPDFLRSLWLTPDSPHGLDGSPMFILLNPGKKSVAINMKTPEGVALVRRLVGWADIVSENFAPGPMQRWGLDYAGVRAIRPDTVMVSACLFGQTGPQRSYPGFGGQGSAISGFNHLTGWPDREAHGPSHTITDSLSPRYVALAAVGALIERERTGEGQYIDLSQIEAAVYSQSEVMVRYFANGEVVDRRGNRDDPVGSHAAPHGVYPARGDDRWIAISAYTAEDWDALCQVMGEPEWTRDERFSNLASRRQHEDALDEHLAAWSADFDAHELMHELQDGGVEAGVVQTAADLITDPQLAHRGHFTTMRHVHLGELAFERSGFRLSHNTAGYQSAGPNLGEHTEEVLRDVLGLEADEIARLLADGITV
jgi:crotonobetainyl-CoA:carnitine CoA-transferase CaiB-like acyl-CoA transferase